MIHAQLPDHWQEIETGDYCQSPETFLENLEEQLINGEISLSEALDIIEDYMS